MPYDPDLPDPSDEDLAPNGRQAWWTCRYCDLRETGNLTVTAEARRCAAHEYDCLERPESEPPTTYDRAAYQTVRAAGLRRDIDYLSRIIDDRTAILVRTWIFEFRTRRAYRAEIRRLEYRIAGIHAHARAIGLDDGWSEPGFKPASLA